MSFKRKDKKYFENKKKSTMSYKKLLSILRIYIHIQKKQKEDIALDFIAELFLCLYHINDIHKNKFEDFLLNKNKYKIPNKKLNSYDIRDHI